MLDEARYEIDRRETELCRLREATQRLEEQKMLLQAYEAGIKHIISPIQNLPLDILGVIFQYICCGKDATDIANNYLTVVWRGEKTNRLPSFDLSSVCIRWYSFVTSMPTLWTSFGNDGYDSISQSLVKTFLERLRSNLIDFKLTDLMLDSPFPPSPLVAHCNRWRHAFIAGSVEFVFRSFLIPLDGCKETLSNLVSLDLECYPDPQTVHFAIILPRLKSLRICGFILDFETPPDNVNNLYLSRVTRINALSFLQSFPNIESLTLDHIDPGIMAPEYTPIVFNTVHSLLLIPPFKSAFLTALKFPRLTHLYLASSRIKTYGLQSIFSLLDQNDNFITLTHLSIVNMSIRYDTIFNLFSRIPSLTQLDLEEPLTDSRRPDTLRWTLELLAAPGTDLQEPTETLESQLTVNRTVVSSSGEDTGSDIVEEEELTEVFAGVGTGRYAPDADGYQSNYLEKDNNSFHERLLLPQLVEVDLALRPRNELLDVVRSRRPIPENTRSDPRESLTDRAWLQTLRVRYPQPHTRNRQVLEDFEALEKSLKPFKEGGLDVVIEIPVLDS
ncbi:hypothetical protein EV360DRAFT_88076 [Lentinula raphanica]|nr:hypothetical protein EV360DRAFT_88076 [Lentinula raphanica]